MHRFFKGNHMTASPATNQPSAPSKAANPVAKPVAKAPAKKAQRAAPKAKPATTPRASQAASKAAPAKAPRKAAVKPSPAKPAVTKPQAAKTKPVKEKKVKVVRDSFTIPKTEFTQIADMKKRAMTLGVEIKKSELIRAGLQIISGLPDASFKKALAAIPTVKTGRPSKA
jgi:hypothetical protein